MAHSWKSYSTKNHYLRSRPILGFRNLKLFHYCMVIFILRLLRLESIFYIFWFTPSQTILLVTLVPNILAVLYPCISEQPLSMVRHSTAEIFGTNLETMWIGKCSYIFVSLARLLLFSLTIILLLLLSNFEPYNNFIL